MTCPGCVRIGTLQKGNTFTTTLTHKEGKVVSFSPWSPDSVIIEIDGVRKTVHVAMIVQPT